MTNNDPIPAIVLAAGLSRRMEGRFKPLLPIGGYPLIYHVVHTLNQVREIGPIILVTGYRSEEVRQAAAGGEHLRAVFNPAYEAGGMVSSVQCGVRSIPRDSPAFLLSLGDQPAILPKTIAHLTTGWKAADAVIAIPSFQGKRGHPVMISARCIPEIAALTSSETLKMVVRRYAEQTVEVPVEDAGVITDIDTPKDYENLLRSWPMTSESDK
ncbi:MAG TPA: nucleotidyltransferase family protein [Tepidisphaeraceae bacterium]|jgi:CTP:molybdopterin cytidylyltransferase MocA|nr:nucleotidyltransferase family protein [Tepidisphaeraceae bacterium]